MAEPTTTPGGMAVDAAGDPADMPRDMVHGVSDELHNVLTLLHSALREVCAIGSEGDADPDNLTDASARAVALLHMGADKVRAMQKRISPYV